MSLMRTKEPKQDYTLPTPTKGVPAMQNQDPPLANVSVDCPTAQSEWLVKSSLFRLAMFIEVGNSSNITFGVDICFYALETLNIKGQQGRCS